VVLNKNIVDVPESEKTKKKSSPIPGISAKFITSIHF
jgi:hypothetical protein